MPKKDIDVHLVSEEVNAVLGVVDTYMKWKQSKKTRGYEHYHPSAFGKCLRQMQYHRYAERGLIKFQEEEFDSKILRLFDKGHNMHNRWARYFKEIGVLRGYWTCKRCMEKYGRNDPIGILQPKECITCSKEGIECNDFYYDEVLVEDESLNICGHCDMILDFSQFDIEKFKDQKLSFSLNSLPKQPIVVDMKTANDYRFKQLFSKGPSLAYRIQLVIYANILPVNYGLLIYENKNNSDVAAYKIDKCTDTVWEKIKEQANVMNDMMPDKLLPPPRPKNKDDYECSNCPFATICHKSKIWKHPKLEEKRRNFYGILL